MSLRLSLLVTLGSCFSIIACSGQGWNIPPGTQCGQPFGVPLTKDVSPNQKVIVSNDKVQDATSDLNDFQAGTYTFASADVTYNEIASPTNPKPLELIMHDDPGMETAQSPVSVGCVANPKFVFTQQDISINFPSTIAVDPVTKAVTITPRTLDLQILPNKLSPQKTVVGTPTVISDIAELFGNGDKPDSYKMFATDGVANDYQLLVNYTCPTNQEPACAYSLTVHMTFAAPPTPGTPPAAPAPPAAAPAKVPARRR